MLQLLCLLVQRLGLVGTLDPEAALAPRPPKQGLAQIILGLFHTFTDEILQFFLINFRLHQAEVLVS